MKQLYSTDRTKERNAYWKVFVQEEPLLPQLAEHLKSITLIEEEGKVASLSIVIHDVANLYYNLQPWCVSGQKVTVHLGHTEQYKIIGPFKVKEVKSNFVQRGVDVTIEAEASNNALFTSRHRVLTQGSLYDLLVQISEEEGMLLDAPDTDLREIDLSSSPVVQRGESTGEMLFRVLGEYGWSLTYVNNTMRVNASDIDERLDALHVTFDRTDATIKNPRVEMQHAVISPRRRVRTQQPETPEETSCPELQQSTDCGPYGALPDFDVFRNMPQDAQQNVLETLSNAYTEYATLSSGTPAAGSTSQGPAPAGSRATPRNPNVGGETDDTWAGWLASSFAGGGDDSGASSGTEFDEMEEAFAGMGALVTDGEQANFMGQFTGINQSAAGQFTDFSANASQDFMGMMNSEAMNMGGMNAGGTGFGGMDLEGLSENFSVGQSTGPSLDQAYDSLIRARGSAINSTALGDRPLEQRYVPDRSEDAVFPYVQQVTRLNQSAFRRNLESGVENISVVRDYLGFGSVGVFGASWVSPFRPYLTATGERAAAVSARVHRTKFKITFDTVLGTVEFELGRQVSIEGLGARLDSSSYRATRIEYKLSNKGFEVQVVVARTTLNGVDVDYNRNQRVANSTDGQQTNLITGGTGGTGATNAIDRADWLNEANDFVMNNEVPAPPRREERFLLLRDGTVNRFFVELEKSRAGNTRNPRTIPSE